MRDRDYAAFQGADEALHRAIIGLAGVPFLLESWLVVWRGLKKLHQRGFEECFTDTHSLREEHEYLVETIARGDAVAAEDAGRRHVQAVWFLLEEQQGAPSGQADTPVQRATAHIAFRMHCPLRLEQVAKTIGFTSAGNLSRLFRQQHGVSFQGYLQKVRLEKAADLLGTTHLPVVWIARRVGYRDVSRFGQHFKRRFGLPASQWREQRSARSVKAQGDVTNFLPIDSRRTV
ncbi:MAG: helix-turn-helix domain-containing protein [Verrucomicrobia bacterium]|nr:helix-turn-helix domain-containing protein [Verrucomicrobiota bacterium]